MLKDKISFGYFPAQNREELVLSPARLACPGCAVSFEPRFLPKRGT